MENKEHEDKSKGGQENKEPKEQENKSTREQVDKNTTYCNKVKCPHLTFSLREQKDKKTG